MRKNLPVTGREYEFGDSAVLVSMTDPRGIISYANDDFVEASGFERDELLGKP
jgi:aerotaxis receptor